MRKKYDLGDLSTEIIGISGTISMLGDCVTPAALPGTGAMLTKKTLEELIFAITQQMDRVAADVSEWEGEFLRLEQKGEARDGNKEAEGMTTKTLLRLMRLSQEEKLSLASWLREQALTERQHSEEV